MKRKRIAFTVLLVLMALATALTLSGCFIEWENGGRGGNDHHGDRHDDDRHGEDRGER